MGQQRQVRTGDLSILEIDSGLPKDATHAGVSVLDFVDRILLRLIECEIDPRIRIAGPRVIDSSLKLGAGLISSFITGSGCSNLIPNSCCEK